MYGETTPNLRLTDHLFLLFRWLYKVYLNGEKLDITCFITINVTVLGFPWSWVPWAQKSGFCKMISISSHLLIFFLFLSFRSLSLGATEINCCVPFVLIRQFRQHIHEEKDRKLSFCFYEETFEAKKLLSWLIAIGRRIILFIWWLIINFFLKFIVFGNVWSDPIRKEVCHQTFGIMRICDGLCCMWCYSREWCEC